MIELKNVTLIGIDCVEISRLQKAMDITEEKIAFADSKLLSSIPTDDPRWIEIENLDSIEKYSEFCIKQLNGFVETEYVLIVQHDGFVLNPQSWSDDFLNYDYIGAPWHFEEEFWFTKFKISRSLKDQRFTGNGGFCIRSKKFLEVSTKLANEGAFKAYHPEDLVLCVFNKELLENEGLTFAPFDVAQRFSIEGSKYTYTNQFGFHGFKWTDISKWIDENPQYGIDNQFEES